MCCGTHKMVDVRTSDGGQRGAEPEKRLQRPAKGKGTRRITTCRYFLRLKAMDKDNLRPEKDDEKDSDSDSGDSLLAHYCLRCQTAEHTTEKCPQAAAKGKGNGGVGNDSVRKTNHRRRG